MSSVHSANVLRLEIVKKAVNDSEFRDQWITAMVTLIAATTKSSDKYFRWHSSGDLLNITHLEMIIRVAEVLPTVMFWLPTKEVRLLKHIEKPSVPKNLIIRVSDFFVDGKPVVDNWPTSGVYTHPGDRPDGVLCPAKSQNNKCGSCRICWTDTPRVIYEKH